MEDHVYPHLYNVEKEHWWFVARQAILLRYLDVRLRLSPGARVLDVGCGTGAVLELFSQRYDAYGTDMSPQAIEFCRQRGLQKLHLGTLDTYPAAEPFDLITMLDVVEHVEDDVAFLRTARRLLRSNGHLLIAVPAFPSLWGRHDDMLHHKRRYTRQSLRRVVGEGGFTIEHLTFLNAFLFPVAWARRAVAHITGSQDANDLMIPSPLVNAALRSVFALEKRIVPHTSLPIGLSLLCLARKEAE